MVSGNFGMINNVNPIKTPGFVAEKKFLFLGGAIDQNDVK